MNHHAVIVSSMHGQEKNRATLTVTYVNVRTRTYMRGQPFDEHVPFADCFGIRGPRPYISSNHHGPASGSISPLINDDNL